MAPEIVVALCALAGTLVGSIGGIIVSSRLTTYRLEQLEKKMDKHNGVIERMAVAERDIKTVFKRIDAHAAKIDRLEDAS